MIFALVAFANTLMAAKTLTIEIQPLSANNAVIAISSPDNSNLKIKVENNSGEVVYYREITGEGIYYRHMVDFSDFERGMYKLTVESNGVVSERPFKISNKTIKVGKEKILDEN